MWGRHRFAAYYASHLLWRAPASVLRLGVLLAVCSVALGVAVMQVSLAVVGGFELAVQRKLVGFEADMQIGPYLPQADRDLRPLPRTLPYLSALRQQLPQVAHTSPYMQKAAILQSAETLEGILLKGVDSTWRGDLFRESLVAGSMPSWQVAEGQQPILLSSYLSERLGLAVGDKARLFFLEDKVRARPVRVVGIYHTGLHEFDQAVVFCNLALLQRINGWPPEQVMGHDVLLAGQPSVADIDTLTRQVNRLLPPDQRARSVLELHPDIFGWLNLQHQNVGFILALMVLVAIVNVASAVLILITERTRSVGLLAALGASQGQLRAVFGWLAFYLILAGVLLGNALGLGLLALQQLTGWVQLDPASYFVRVVPVAWDIVGFVWVNVGVVLLCALSMLLPTWLVQRISVVQALKV